MRTLLKRHRSTLLKIMITLFGLAGFVGALWWALFALKPYDITPAALQARYEHAAPNVAASLATEVQLGAIEPLTVGQTPAWSAALHYRSFDGDAVVGRITYPHDPRTPPGVAPSPVLLALHGMGRTQARWWQAEFKGRPTIENTHRVAELALQRGYVVLALDARLHGERKDVQRPLLSSDLMRDLHVWGQREPYERLVIDTVKDYRVLLDWVQQQPQLDATRVRAAGYSMGAQMALLLAGTDRRVRSVAAMVPPHLDNKVAAVAPINVAPQLKDVQVWLLTGDDDEYASADDNAALFAALPGPGRQHLRFAGGHLLPAGYVEQLAGWFNPP